MQNRQSLWSNSETFKFINFYRNESDIWNLKNKEYKDKTKVKQAWARIEKGMGLSVEELKRKKEALMATFRSHYRKKLKTGYKPIWIYYEAMEEFLDSVYEPKVSYHDEDKDIDPLLCSQDKTEIDEDNEDDDDDGEVYLIENSEKPQKKRRKSTHIPELQEASNQMAQAFKILNDTLQTRVKNHRQEPSDDESDLYGKLVAKKLRQFPDTDRQEIMYEIDGLLLKRLRERHQFENYEIVNQ